ncbi:beta-phosphoglucomutase [Kingella kingae]|uniref:beta-phosphoglucomutase n=1 Tax=Kingella kingae TaxID=504 RepID=UPI0003FA9EDF|nr:beta-phosphoglucomutase [Kingella kingae]MBD3614605.1 beta-phosphoglucomutase [Kingella kingae]MBD3632938.1 beta-phosphoglucomutase [Kingella kingae]MBD3660224.1 beta-phosphoglucomutase [Kingella kingae]MDK4527662.1 beta-phosphoglucomutase [Kingella kingae]MDK4542216.1 beta-phosphoglucomutase [Kingella kingae]
MTFQAVLFDLDGVITDTAEYHFLAWQKLAEELGISIDRQFNEQLKGVSRDDSLKRILAHGNKTVSPEEFKQLTERKNANYLTMIEAVSPNDVYAGILDLLKALRENGKKIALASASKNGPKLLQQMQLTEYFDCIADPAKVAQSKPAPDIFLAAAAGVDVAIENCIGIEDAAAGVAAIKAAGALPIGVGKASDLGDDIAIVADTSFLTLNYLENVWQNTKYS